MNSSPLPISTVVEYRARSTAHGGNAPPTINSGYGLGVPEPNQTEHHAYCLDQSPRLDRRHTQGTAMAVISLLFLSSAQGIRNMLGWPG
jgi:hypothetical protein